MIVTCPQCNTSFEVPTQVLQPDGKKVKCTKCSHIWFQTLVEEDHDDSVQVNPEPEALQVSEELVPATSGQASETDSDPNPKEMDFDIGFQDDPSEESAAQANALADGAKSDVGSEKQSLSTTAKNFLREKPIALAACCAVLIFILTLFISIVLRGPITSAFPAYDVFYKLVGLGYADKGEELALNNLHAQIEFDQKTLTVSGDLVNLSSDRASLMPLMATQLDENGKALKEWVIQPPVSSLDPAGVVSFESQYPLEELATQVNIGFSLLAEKILTLESNNHENTHSGEEESNQANQGRSPEQEDHHKSPEH